MKCAATVCAGTVFRRSPCIGCKDRLAEYACVDKCPLPGQYAASIGDMNHGMPDHLCHFGKHMTFSPPSLPVTRDICSVELPKSIGGKGVNRKRYSGPRTQICLWPGCQKPVHSGFCSQHTLRMSKRQYCAGWPLRFVMAPLKKQWGFLLVAEARGKLDSEPWYIESIRLIQNGELSSSAGSRSMERTQMATRMTPSEALKEEIERAIRKYAERTGAFVTDIKIICGEDRADGIKTIDDIEIATNLREESQS